MLAFAVAITGQPARSKKHGTHAVPGVRQHENIDGATESSEGFGHVDYFKLVPCFSYLRY